MMVGRRKEEHPLKTCIKRSVLAPLSFAYGLVTIGLFALAISAQPFCQQNAFAQSDQPAPPGILIATTDEGVRYLVGGVGSDERKMMQQLDADYNVKFVFADAFGDYISDVAVLVDDLQGKSVARLVTNGPWLYVKLPAGGYRVQATHLAKTTEIQRLEVPKPEGIVLTLHWRF
jgi:hypothetical protein